MNPKDHAILMAYDAFRMALGIKPRNFTVEQVICWLTLIKA